MTSDGSGAVDREEFMTVLKDIGMKSVNDTVVSDIFREMGLNKSNGGPFRDDLNDVELSLPRFNEAFRLYRARSGFSD